MTPLKKLRRAIAKQIERHPEHAYALTYLRASLDYFIFNGRTPDTVAALKRALQKFEQTT